MKEEVFKILESFSKLDISSLKYSDSDFTIELSKDISTSESLIDSEDKLVQNSPVKSSDLNTNSNFFKVRSPLVGVFYSKPSPDSDKYVEIGDNVVKGDVLCTLEAMKMFNEVKSPVDGIIKKICYSDEDLVGFDDVLFEIEEN